MAATGNSSGQVVFTGGSLNPYNFNGIGYNGMPAEAESAVFSFDFESEAWSSHGHLPEATMDHRGLPFSNGWYHLIGGMRAEQKPVADVIRFRIESM